LNQLSSTDIESYFKNNKKFGGVFANDELKNTDPKKFYIINLQNHNQSGSHWCLLHNKIYIDPFGQVPTIAISKYTTKYSDEDYQNYKSQACGYFCCYFGDNITAGKDPFHGLTKDTLKNEHILQQYFSRK
jgi:hypothetical protein